jgi:dTDP-4-dehydrorhamnose reductase
VKLLIFGRSGQVARELARRCPADVLPTFLDRDHADLADPAQCAQRVADSDADAVINAAAWTAVDAAEENEEAATLINGDAPGAMARACAAKGMPLLHISTDYVFDGSSDRPYRPNDPVCPLSAYGRSKLRGEMAVRESGAQHVILRTSWVVSSHGKNFVKTMLRLGAERTSLNVVANQFGGPTPAASIADALYSVVRSMMAGRPGGTYHFSGTPDTDWAAFAREIMAATQLACRIDNIATADYPTPAKRPLNSRLDCSALFRDFGIDRPNWRVGLTDIVKDFGHEA